MSLPRAIQQCLDSQSAHAALNAFVACASPTALLSQHQTFAALGDPCPGPLHGRLIAVKDNVCTADFPTTAASRGLAGFSSAFDATVVGRVREAGGLVAGKTNLDEFGMGSHSANSTFGAVRPPRSTYSAGGSSGGSAVAAQTGACWAALGTDTGGSIRLPAAYTGTVGFKPTYGLLSRWGVIAYANSLDTVGIVSRHVGAAEDVFNALNHHDPLDPTSFSHATRHRIRSRPMSDPARPIRIGIPLDYNVAELDPTVRRTWLHAIQLLQNATFPRRKYSGKPTFHPISLPSTQHALAAYYILAPAEASSNLARFDGIRFGLRAQGQDGSPTTGDALFFRSRAESFGEEVRRRILLGTFSLCAAARESYFGQAQRVRRLISNEFDSVLEAPNLLVEDQDLRVKLPPPPVKVDLILCPTSPVPPPQLAQVLDQTNNDPLAAYLNDVFTVPASLGGLPALSVPVHVPDDWEGQTDGRGGTVGIQIIGQVGCDAEVLQLGRALEASSAAAEDR